MEVKECIVLLKDEDGRDTADVGKMTCILNQYFATVFTEEDLGDMPVPTNMCNSDEVMDEIDTSQSAVYQKLRNLDPEKEVGDDNINPAILRNVADQFAVPLSIIFTTSMKSGKIPQDWRTANVTPIYKKGSKNIASNYRPISLTSQVGKVMEKLVKESIVAHLNKRNLIRESQHGFMEGKSCLTNLLSSLETATSYSDQGLPVDILYLDFSKAFDKVPHQRLITKLKAHGIGDTVANWVKGWLTDREQRVTIKGKQSPWLPVKSGVPQGSVLGPTLFVVYINDIDDNICSHILKFADDTKISDPLQLKNK